eukprot:12885475-Prorocentrum_lima.AAC.1
MSPVARHFWWRQVLGLIASDPGVDEHHFLSELLEYMAVYDQFNLGECLVAEAVARRYQLWEETYSAALREAETGDSSGAWLDERH